MAVPAPRWLLYFAAFDLRDDIMFKASTKGSRRRLGSSTSGFGLRRAFAVGALLCSGVALQALAEEVDATESRAAETAIEEEVVVRGQRRSAPGAELRPGGGAVRAALGPARRDPARRRGGLCALQRDQQPRRVRYRLQGRSADELADQTARVLAQVLERGLRASGPRCVSVDHGRL